MVASTLSGYALDASIVLGALIILATLWVYVRHKTLGGPGLALALLGFLLVGGSIYKNVSVSVGKDGFEAKLEQFEKTLKEVESQTEAVSGSVAELRKGNAELREEVRTTREEILKRPAFDPAVVERMKGLADVLGGLQKRTDAIDVSLGKLLDPRSGIEARMKELVNSQTKELADKLAGSIIRPR